MALIGANNLRWGLIGCGDISRKRVAPALRSLPECELIGVSRARVDRAEAFAAEFGAKRWYGDWRELIADDEIDAVYIARRSTCTPSRPSPRLKRARASCAKNRWR